jgi:hypothetical protein
MSTGCGIGQSIPDELRNDKLLHLQKGHYYGHPNLKRATYFKDPRQCVWQPAETKSTATYTQPLLTPKSSIDGVMEFQSNHFGSQLRHNLIFIQYLGVNNIFRVILNDEGTAPVQSSQKALPLKIGTRGLDITQAPNGNIIEMRYNSNSIWYHKPDEAPTSEMILKTVFPRRGPSSGRNTLYLYGVNLNSNTTRLSVSVGDKDCALLTVSSKMLSCILPGGQGTVDITITDGTKTSTFGRGYRYISGIPSLGFKLPVYS